MNNWRSRPRRPLLTPHSIKHDVESIFYVVCWLCTVASGPDCMIRPPSDRYTFGSTALSWWFPATGVDLRSIECCKRGCICDWQDFEKDIMSCFHPYWAEFKDAVLVWRDLLDLHSCRSRVWTDVFGRNNDIQLSRESCLRILDYLERRVDEEGAESDPPVEPGAVEDDTSIHDIPYCKMPDGNADLLRNWKAGGVSPGYPVSCECDSVASSLQSDGDD